MTMRVSWLFDLAAAVALVATAAPASAQTPQAPGADPVQATRPGGRPFRGIFGGGLGNTEQTLTFTGTLGGGYESDYLAALVGDDSALGRPARGGAVGVGSATVAYSLGRERASISAAATSSAFYYERAGDTLTQSHRFTSSQGLQIARRTRVSATEYVNRQPFRLDRLFPAAQDFSFGAPPALPSDSFAGAEEYVDLGADADISHQISERLSVSGGVSHWSSELSADSRRTFTGGRAGVGVSIARGPSVRLGYGRYQSRYVDGGAERLVRHDNIDVGLDYAGAISLTRRTRLSFGTGSNAIHDRDETHFRLTGRAQLDREIGRTWVAAIAYARDAYYVDQLQDVVLSDSVTFSMGGLLSRRVSLHSGVGASFGNVGFGQASNDAYATYAIAGLVTALTRLTALGVDYTYYLHSFGADITLPGGVVREIDRQSIRAYITVWAPLFSRIRSPHATR